MSHIHTHRDTQKEEEGMMMGGNWKEKQNTINSKGSRFYKEDRRKSKERWRENRELLVKIETDNYQYQVYIF